MNDLQIFNNSEFGEIRTVLVDDEPMFCLLDVCKALMIRNTSDVAKRLDEDEVTRLNLGSKSGETWFINESGLYTTILRSDKPSAKKFRKWVTSEILPSIRKTGSYSVDMTSLTPELQMAKALLDAQIKQQQQIQAIETKVDNICDIMTMPIGDWKADINKMVREISQKSNIPYQETWTKLYAELELKAKCSLQRLVDNKAKRMTKAGNTKTAIKDATTKIAVIFDKPQLKEIFTSIVREWSIKYCA